MIKLKMGMVGGGIDSFIGSVHRMAAAMDGHIELVCGALSSTPERSRKSGEQLGLPPERIYGDFIEMIEKESRLPEEKGWILFLLLHQTTCITNRRVWPLIMGFM